MDGADSVAPHDAHQSETIIRNHYETAVGWFLHILFPTRDELTHTHAFCSDHNLSFEIRSVRAFDGDQFDSRYTLTNEQYEAVMHAFESGYFAVYRNIITEELAKEFDISHQALSERLHCAHHALIDDTLSGQPVRHPSREQRRHKH